MSPFLADILNRAAGACRLVVRGLRPPPVLGHVLRTVLAAVLALYLAYYLQLESPFSAVATVMLVTHPLSGAVVSKSLWRVVGTLIGTSAATVLVALFAQTPELFLGTFSLFLGTCVAIATLLRFFRSYAAVLSGYTVALVAFGAIDDPYHIFDLATARLAVVCLGIGCKMLVSCLLAPGTAARHFDARMAKAITAVAQCIVAGACGEPKRALDRQRTALIAELHKLDELAGYAAAESAYFGQRVNAVRAAIAALFSALTGTLGRNATLDRLAVSWPSHPELAQTRDVVIGGLVELVTSRDDLATDTALARRHLAVTARRVAKIGRQVATVGTSEDLSRLVTIDQLGEMLEQFITALDGLHALQTAPSRRPRIGAHIDWDPKAALVNGGRAAVAVAIASVFWIASEWPSGPQMLTWTSVICALLATRPNPVAASLNALRAIFWAALLGFVYTFGVLPEITGFPLLAMTLSLFLGGSAYLATRPATADLGVFFPLFFVTLVAPTNPMHFDVGGYLNTAFALIVGVACSVLAFHVILPVDPRREIRRFVDMILSETEALARNGVVPDLQDWENRQRRRLVRIADRLPRGGSGQAATLETAFAAVQIGRSLTTVLKILNGPNSTPVLRRIADNGLASLRQLRSSPTNIPAALSALAQELTALFPEAGERRRGYFKMAAAFEEISTLTASAVGKID